MKKITIQCCPQSSHLRTEALLKAIEFETEYSENGYGIINGVLWKLLDNNYNIHQIYVYQTKKYIISDVRMEKKDGKN